MMSLITSQAPPSFRSHPALVLRPESELQLNHLVWQQDTPIQAWIHLLQHHVWCFSQERTWWVYAWGKATMIRPIPNHLQPIRQANHQISRQSPCCDRISNGNSTSNAAIECCNQAKKMHQPVTLERKRHATRIANSWSHVPHCLDRRSTCLLRCKPSK